MQHAEKQITTPVQLCDKKGNLNPEAIGYAKSPIVDCNLSGHFMRKKKWNHWTVYGEDIILSATVSHLDYAAICSVFFLEYETERYFEKTVTLPIVANLKMPTKVKESVYFKGKDLKIELNYIHGATYLTITCDDFEGELLHAELIIHHPTSDESLNVVVPWNSKIFHFTSKQHTLPTSGVVKVGLTHYRFKEDECFAVHDFGRGVLPREMARTWGMASQLIRGKRVGLNLGGYWTDGTGMTENAIFIDGKMTKIHEDLIFTFNKANDKKPWLIHTKFSQDLKLSFTPFFECANQTDLKLVKTRTKQFVGYFNGYITLHDGSRLAIQQMLGTIEEHIAKW